MYVPLQWRLTLFYMLVLGLALWFFGYTVYVQARERAYSDLDALLSTRAASVRLGKSLACGIKTTDGSTLPTLPSVDALGTGGVAIEVLDTHLHLLVSTAGQSIAFDQTSVDGLGSSPVPWDEKAARQILQENETASVQPAMSSTYSTITYAGQQVRVYSLINNFCGITVHIIQTARSERDIEQSLESLRLVLLQGGALVLLFALVGGWFIPAGLLSAVRRMTKTARSISTARNFRQRVPSKRSWLGRDELATLAATFNEMLGNLEQVYQQQQRFVADASHELRAPITSIRCNLDLLVKAPDLPAAEAEAALNDARAEANRMGRLVSDLLILARADALSQTELNAVDGYKKRSEGKNVVDLDSLLLEVFRQYQPGNEKGSSKGEREGRQRPRLLLQHIIPVRVYGEVDELKQVLVALVDNALKYTPHEGTVSLSLTMAERWAVMKVSDTGIGIAAEDLPHIFERFYRADRARSRDRGGSGLGLAIVESLVKEHGGVVQVESIAGKGSSFIVKLPRA
ncbi:MAG: HAMP domain-containing sensor histidine kinase [Ktedonobacteraceae bacterium]